MKLIEITKEIGQLEKILYNKEYPLTDKEQKLVRQKIKVLILERKNLMR